MDRTTRALAVVAAAAVLLVPVVNGVLEEAVATADRVVLDEADWDREPPEDPPDAEPPEDAEGNVSAGGGSTCPLTRELVAGWNHDKPDQDPLTAAENRSQDPTTQSFEVTNRTRALGIALEVTNMTGEIAASVYAEGGEDEAPFQVQQRHDLPANVTEGSTISPPALEPGTWTAELQHQRNHHDELTFVVIAFTCEGAAS